MKNRIYDYTRFVNPTYHIAEMIDALKESEKSDPAKLKLVVDNSEGYIYVSTRYFFQKCGYKVVKISLKDVYDSDQYAVLMDFFGLLDRSTPSISIISIATFLVKALMINFRDNVDKGAKAEAIKVVAGFLNQAYEEGNVSFNDMLSELASHKLLSGAVRKINSACKNIVSGYDFTLDDVENKKLVIYIIPPETTDAEGKSFLIPMILYLFKLYSNFREKSELIITDIADIGITPYEEMVEITEYLSHEKKTTFMIGYNGDQWSEGNISASTMYFLENIT